MGFLFSQNTLSFSSSSRFLLHAYHTYLPYHAIPYMPYHTNTTPQSTIPYQCHKTKPYYTNHAIPIPFRSQPYHTNTMRQYHTIPIPLPTIPSNYHSAHHRIPHHTQPYHQTIFWQAGRPRLSEEGIGTPYYLSGFVPLPPLQGGPA